MKLMIFFLIVVCLHVSAAGYGQNGTVTISGKDLSLEKVFSVIKKQTDYVCFYGYDIMKDAKPVTLSFKDADVQEVLKAALWGQGLDFSITGKTITIVKKMAASAVTSPGRTVRAAGTVYNEAGQPLSGANVTIKATGKGTITNAKGEFELPAVPEESPLVISFIGYAPQVVRVNEGKEMQVYLNVAKNELDKVVVQAYGTTTQRLATGNIATVTAAEIARQPVTNVLQALQGHVAGMNITQTSGYASAPFKVEIRGRNMLADVPSDPLYIIDGVPLTILEAGGVSSYKGGSTGFSQAAYTNGPAGGQSPLFSLNPNDIESVTVLKDADATAIYGSRGANGVILITTKTAKAEKTSFDLNVYHGIDIVTRRYKLLNTKQYLEMRKEAVANDGLQSYLDDPNYAIYFPDLKIWDSTRYTDWQNYIWGGTGRTTDLELALSGGTKQTSFRLGMGYKYISDITTKKGANQRGSIQFNLSHKSLDQRFSIDFANNYSLTDAKMIALDNLATLSPNAPAVYDASGHLNYGGWAPANSQYPFGVLERPYDGRTYFINSRLLLRYELIKGLTISASFGYSNANLPQNSKTPILSQDPSLNPTGSVQFSNNVTTNYIIEPQLEYSRYISKGKLSILAGGSAQNTSVNGNTIFGSGYTNDNLLGSVSNAGSKDAFDVFAHYKYAAAFGRINYNWENKYIINLTARRDGSSRFGPGKQFGNFASVGSAWIFSEESWIKDHLSFLSLGKLRSSYGITGADQIGDYQYLSAWTASNIIPYQGTNSYIPLQHANPDYRWEENRKLEVALILGFLKDRLNVEVAWYRNRCGNQLVNYPLSVITGFTQVTANFPANVQNTGTEFLLNSKIIEGAKINWSVNFNIGINRNKLLSFANIDQTPYAYRFVVGKSLYITQELHYTGVDPQTGQYTFEDKNKDGNISTNVGPTGDLYVYDLTPKYSGGLGSDLSYKNWDLNVFFHFIKQRGTNALAAIQTPGGMYNEPVSVLDRWQKPGDKASVARFTMSPSASDNNFLSSDALYTDASYIRLQNLAVSYTLPEKAGKKLHINSWRFYLQGSNLFTITGYKGLDPEAQNFGGMPTSRVFTGGVNINF